MLLLVLLLVIWVGLVFKTQTHQGLGVDLEFKSKESTESKLESKSSTTSELSNALTAPVQQVDVIQRMMDDRKSFITTSNTQMPYGGINANFESNISSDDKLDGIIASENTLTGANLNEL